MGFTTLSFGQEKTLKIWPDKIPGAIEDPSYKMETITDNGWTRIDKVSDPTLDFYPAPKEKSNGTAVVICPGGGYAVLAIDHEGAQVAKWFNSMGITAFVLKYRLPSDKIMVDKSIAPLQDAQEAMRIVRRNAKKWNINPDKIGIMGFSAGGHLASTLGTHFDYGNKNSDDLVERQSCRPDFMILMYPVISFTDSCTHAGSREALLGKNPDQELVKLFSNELQVKADTPPTFIVQADDDTTVPIENSILMFEALKKKKIPTELHILSEGGHGFGLAVNNPHINSWTNSLSLWLKWLNSKSK